MANLRDLWRSRRARWTVGVGGAVIAAAALVVPSAVAGADGASAIHVVVDGYAVTPPTPPVLIGGQVLLPLRDVAEALGLSVHWDASTDTVHIGDGTGSAPASPTTIPLVATTTSAAPDPAAAPAGTSFTHNGLQYAAVGLVARPYPGDQTDSGTYWIIEYTITDVSSTPISVPAAQALVLLGPDGSEIAADGALGGAAPTVLNPGITFTSHDVFNVPSSASPASYALGFVPYQVVGSQYYAAKPLTMRLPGSSSSTTKVPVDATYDLQNMFSNAQEPTSEQTLTIADVVKTNAVAPDLTAASFKPDTSFWIVDFTLANTTSGDISLAAGDFTLDFDGENAIAPSKVSSLPGYAQPTGLQNATGVTVPTGRTFRGSLLFPIPAGTPTDNPELQLSAGGQTRIVSLTPCAADACPPVLG